MRAIESSPPSPAERVSRRHRVLVLDGRSAKLAAARPSVIAKEVIGLLASMGYRKTEARWLVWTALRSGELATDRPPTHAELLRAALRAGQTRSARSQRR